MTISFLILPLPLSFSADAYYDYGGGIRGGGGGGGEHSWRDNGVRTPTWTAGNSSPHFPPLSDAERRESQRELEKIEDEIKTLRQVCHHHTW